jgi:hypothetical protein
MLQFVLRGLAGRLGGPSLFTLVPGEGGQENAPRIGQFHLKRSFGSTQLSAVAAVAKSTDWLRTA